MEMTIAAIEHRHERCDRRGEHARPRAATEDRRSARANARSGSMRAAPHVRPPARGDPSPDRQHLSHREHGRRRAVREPTPLVQEEHGEAADAELRRDRASAAADRQSARSLRRGTAPGRADGRASARGGPSRITSPPTAVPAKQAIPSVAKPQLDAAGCDDRRQGDG